MLVQDYPVSLLQGRGVVPEGYQRREEREEDVGVDSVDPLPNRVGDAIRARGSGR